MSTHGLLCTLCVVLLTVERVVRTHVDEQSACSIDLCISKETDLSKCIPVVLHGDDADSHRRRSFLIVTFGSLLVCGTSMWDSKYLLYCLDVSQAVSQTFEVLDMWLAWSLMELQMGMFMDTDPWNRRLSQHQRNRQGQIAEGFRAVLVVHKGDEKYLQRAYKASHGAVSKQVCVHCHASSQEGALLYTQHGLTAPHRSTMISTEQFIEKVAGTTTFISLPGWNISMLMYDWLHIVDLTIIPEVSASCLVELVAESAFGPSGTADERLRLAYVSFRQWCREARVRNRGQIFSMFLGLGLFHYMQSCMAITVWDWTYPTETVYHTIFRCVLFMLHLLLC